MTKVAFLMISLLSLCLTACSGGAVQFAPTPLPPDLSPLQYTHPSNAFSIAVPRHWANHTQNFSTLATISFTSPDNTQPNLLVSVIKLQADEMAESLDTLIDRYQTQLRPDLLRYTEQDRQFMADGSWRVTGVRNEIIGQPIQVNTFFQRNEAHFAVIEVILMDDFDASVIQSAINTLILASDSTLDLTDLTAFADTSPSLLEMSNVSLWTAPDGVFYITGEIANHTDMVFTDVPIRASLISQDGAEVAGAIDSILGHAILPGGFAPFGLRFGQGQPLNAISYRVAVEGATPPEGLEPIVSGDQLEWTDEFEFASDGQIFISGIVQNIGGVAVRDTLLMATVFDEVGQVIGVGWASADISTIQADTESSYVILVSDLGGVPANYIVNAQAIRCVVPC